MKQFVLKQTDKAEKSADPCTDFPAKRPLTEIYVDDIYFCREYRLVCVQGQEITLTPKEFDLLTILISHPMNVFTYKVIADLIWQNEYDFYYRKTICNHISNLRKKLRVSSDSPNYIKSIHGIGYRFAP